MISKLIKILDAIVYNPTLSKIENVVIKKVDELLAAKELNEEDISIT
jgi:hypothetical protein